MSPVTNNQPRVVDVLVVGAGIAGIMAARRLLSFGVKATVIEAGAAAGGRLATRRVGRGIADSGAQFFTVRTKEFRVEVDSWSDEARIFEWSRGWSDGSLQESQPDGFPRYAARGGFGSLAKYLSSDLDICFSVQLESVVFDRGEWVSTDSDGHHWHSRSIILTPPVPQSLALLDRGHTYLSPAKRDALAKIRYAPCLSGIFEVDGDIDLPMPGALQKPHSPVSWIADNHRKGISPDGRTITVHAGREASARQWVSEDNEILGWMLAEIRPLLGDDVRTKSSYLDRWPFAVPEACYPERFIVDWLPGPVAFAGDAFNGPRVEGAALSGMAAADSLLGWL